MGIVVGALLGCKNPLALLVPKIFQKKDKAKIDQPAHHDGLKSESQTQTLNGNILKASDGQSQITLPEGWIPISSLNEKAELQAGNRASIMYVAVLTESRADFENMDIQKHSDTTRDSLKSALTAINEQGPFKITVGGFSAIQYEIIATFENVKLGYLHTTVESSKNYYQIIAWTLYSKFVSQKNVLNSVIASFKEL